MGKGITFGGYGQIDYNETDIPLKIFNGTNIPYEDQSFDSVLVVEVFHHCNNPEKVLKEAIRVAKKKVIIFDMYP